MPQVCDLRHNNDLSVPVSEEKVRIFVVEANLVDFTLELLQCENLVRSRVNERNLVLFAPSSNSIAIGTPSYVDVFS